MCISIFYIHEPKIYFILPLPVADCTVELDVPVVNTRLILDVKNMWLPDAFVLLSVYVSFAALQLDTDLSMMTSYPPRQQKVGLVPALLCL